MSHPSTERLRNLVRDVPDFPTPGIDFKDITPMLGDEQAFATVIDLLAQRFDRRGITKVVGIEARGFIVAAPVAYRLEAGFVPARKQGKLPWQTVGVAYELEYGSERLELHEDAVSGSDRVLIVDDVLATGGTARAAIDVVERLGAEVAGIGVIIELSFLNGRDRLNGTELYAVLAY